MLSSRPLTFVALGLALSLVALAGGCDRQSGEKAQPQPAASATGGTSALVGTVDRSHRGSPLPKVTVKDPAGKALALDSLKGPVLINLWATWCGPCVIELPLLDKLAAERAGRLRIVTVSEDMADGAKVAAFLASKGVTRLEPWLDPENDLAFAYGSGTLPTTIYFDASGKEVWRLIGGHDWSSTETANLLAEAD